MYELGDTSRFRQTIHELLNSTLRPILTIPTVHDGRNLCIKKICKFSFPISQYLKSFTLLINLLLFNLFIFSRTARKI